MNSLHPVFLSVMASPRKHFTPRDEDKYVPGVCNIGRREIARRRNATLFCVLMCAGFVMLCYFVGLSRGFRLLLFLPAAALGVTFQQWYFKFCVAFGLKGIFNFGEIGKAFTVEEQEYRRKDYEKAIKIIFSGAGFGMIVALAFFFAPW